MRKQELDNWVKNGGDLPDELTEDEKSYLGGLGWECLEDWEGGFKWGELHLLKGKKHGVCKEWCSWYVDGHLSEIERYLNGERHGKQETWEYDGTKDSECNYHHGKPHGKQVSWWFNGQKHYEYNYHYGKEHGTWKTWYDDDGTLEEHKEYAYGFLLKDFLKEEKNEEW